MTLALQVQVASNSAVQALAKINYTHALNLIESGALEACLKQLDIGTNEAKEASLWTLQAFAQSHSSIAEMIATPDTLKLCVSLMQANDAVPGVQKAALGALKQIAMHGWKLARAVVAVGPLPTAVMFSKNERTIPVDVRAAAFGFLAQITKHDDDLAGQVADAGTC